MGLALPIGPGLFLLAPASLELAARPRLPDRRLAAGKVILLVLE